MRRTRLRTALLLVVAAALGGIGYLVTRSVSKRKTDLLSELGRDLQAQVAQRIKNFRRVKVEQGRVVWEITAKDAQYYEATRQVVVQEPRMTFFVKGQDRATRVEGDEGRLVLDGQEVLSLTLRGSVTVTFDEMRVEMDEATYVRTRDVITSTSPVTIRGPTLEVTGRGMEIEIEPQQVRLMDDVRTTLRNSEARS